MPSIAVFAAVLCGQICRLTPQPGCGANWLGRLEKMRLVCGLVDEDHAVSDHQQTVTGTLRDFHLVIALDAKVHSVGDFLLGKQKLGKRVHGHSGLLRIPEADRRDSAGFEKISRWVGKS